MEAGAATTRVRTEANPRALRLGRWLIDRSLNVYAGLALVYLMVPIAIILVFSFNHPKGKFNFIWHGFSLDAWKHPFAVEGLGDAMKASLEIAALSTIVATILGTLMALALVRYEFRGRALSNLFIFIPLATPEVVLGASLLSMFLSIGFATGFATILIAHIMFNVSFVVVTVRSRLIGFDRSLEEAAQDLGATGFQTFVRITLPLIMPGVAAAALLAFALSIDDFVITNFVSGTTNTFPIWVYSIQRNALPVQINVVGSIVFLGAVGLVLMSSLRSGGIPRLR
jgi:spermidine/putrescine transport system permease protein